MFKEYLNTIIPVAAFNTIGSSQNFESGEDSGDSFPTAPSLAIKCLGTIGAVI